MDNLSSLNSLNDIDRQAIREFSNKIRAVLANHLVNMKLYGSKSRGEDNAESDIDILVEIDKLKKDLWDQVMDIAFEVNLKWNVYISPRVLSSDNLRLSKWEATPFVQNLKREGLLI